jgi:hypothetical protein
MLQLKNNSPFVPSIAVFPNERGIDTLYVAVKATFAIGATLEIAEQQQPIVLADEYWGEPCQSSIKLASDVHLCKPATDILLVGEACAPERRPVSQLDVSVSVGPYRDNLRVFGDRVWEKGMFGTRASAPQVFETMPLVYERAFGGVEVIDADTGEVAYEPRNPVGRGFHDKRAKIAIDGTPLPNLEDPAQLLARPYDRPAPKCFAPVAAAWEPRKSFAGTYDETWQKTQAPFLPRDFNPRFFNCASVNLIGNGYLRGGEPVEISNASPRGVLRFALPVCELVAEVRVAGQSVQPPLNLETVLLQPTDARVTLLWRVAVACDKKALKVEQVTIEARNLDVKRRAA